MRNIIIIITFFIGIIGVCQETPKEIKDSSLELKFDMRLNQARFEFKSKLFNQDVSTLLIIRYNKIELFEGKIFSIGEYITIIPSAGLEYLFDEKNVKPRLRLSTKFEDERIYMVINYGSDWLDHDVTTKIAYGLIGNRLQIGVASINADLGPLLRMKVRIGKQNPKTIKTYVSYVDNQVRFSIKFNIKEYTWIQKLNPFHKK